MDFFPVLRGCTAEFSRQPQPREVDLISVGLTPMKIKLIFIG
jgi:hypothetical protein